MSSPLVKAVEEMSKSKPVFIFMKGSPEFPMCGFSARACAVLKQAGAQEMGSFDLLSDDTTWDALIEYTNWPTSPQVFIKGEFVGGCDIVTEMFERGDLQKMIG